MKTALFLCAALIAGCAGRSNLVVTSAAVQKASNVSAAIPGEFSGTSPSMGELYWVEGKIRNEGREEARRVTVTFRCTDGNTKRLFVAEIDRIPPGSTVAFQTDRFASPLEIRLLEGEPEITSGD
jgi:hypothetical protein